MIRKKASSGPRSRTSTKSRRPVPKKKVAPPRPAPVRESEEEREPTAAPELSAKRRRELRADAHGLEPIVHVGHGGLSESVQRAVSRALLDHELIKVRLHEPEDKNGMASELASATRSTLCGLVGHTVILYRPKPKQRGVSGVARTAIKRNRERRGRP